MSLLSAPHQHFRFCPHCGGALPSPPREAVLRCPSCRFVYFFNPAIGVGGFLSDPRGRVLWLRRAKDPARGRLALPGGFVDYNETAEEALRREILEEVGLATTDLQYLCSQPNDYHYAQVTYKVLDIFFRGDVAAPEQARALDGAESIVWIHLDDLDPDDIAFPSVRLATARYAATGRGM